MQLKKQSFIHLFFFNLSCQLQALLNLLLNKFCLLKKRNIYLDKLLLNFKALKMCIEIVEFINNPLMPVDENMYQTPFCSKITLI